MKRINTQNMGWAVALVLIGVIAGSGFQGATEKHGIVDMMRVAKESDFYKQSEINYRAMVDRRRGLLEFFNQYKVLSPEQTKRIEELSLKDNLSAQEKAELERQKAAVIAQDTRSKELTIKTNPTPEERTLMEDYARRANVMQNDTLPRLSQQYEVEAQQSADTIQSSALEKARDAVREVGKQQGYTIVFNANAAPYGANDITDAALKAMNAKK